MNPQAVAALRPGFTTTHPALCKARPLGVVADVVVGIAHADVELGVGRNLERLTGHGLLPLVAAVQLVLAGTAHALHDLGGGRAKGQRGGQHHAHGLLGAVGQGEAVADALAVKVDIGLGGQGDAGDVVGAHEWNVRAGDKGDQNPAF